MLFFNMLNNNINEKITPQMQPAGELPSPNDRKIRADGSSCRNPLVTPLPPSVIRMEWTA